MVKSTTLKSKTFWAGIVSVVTGVGMVIQGDVGNGVMTAVMGVLAIVGRDAISKVQAQ
jgi:hypothetical protein